MDLALNNLQRLICHKTQPTILLLLYHDSVQTCSHLSVWLSNQSWSEAMHMLVHQLPQYYQSQ